MKIKQLSEEVKALSDKVANVDKKLAGVTPSEFEKGQFDKSMAELEVKLELAPPELAIQHAELLNKHFESVVVELNEGKIARADFDQLSRWVVYTLGILPGDPDTPPFRSEQVIDLALPARSTEGSGA